MAVKFLSEEWAQAVTQALNGSDDFKKAAGSQSVKVQQVVTDVPDGGEAKYHFSLQDGNAQVGLGESAEAEATLTQNYDTAVAIAKGETDATQAFMQGKVKGTGNLMKLMQLTPAFKLLPQIHNTLDVEY